MSEYIAKLTDITYIPPDTRQIHRSRPSDAFKNPKKPNTSANDADEPGKSK